INLWFHPTVVFPHLSLLAFLVTSSTRNTKRLLACPSTEIFQVNMVEVISSHPYYGPYKEASLQLLSRNMNT
uniref:Uncharacterized protein n=1 Tax=Triticum urartu TaxID=4572 RepID=A0A8R7NY72_TRIUA